MSNTLYVVATPIGNLQDITSRAIEILTTVPTIACEDTRHTGQLVKLLDRQTPVKYLSVRDWNEAKQLASVLVALQQGDVALVSDAGTPLISDPGYKVVQLARAAGFTVSPIPGPSAAIAALSASGLPTNKVMFYGFEHGPLQYGATTVLYESPKRINATLQEIRKQHAQAEIVLAHELTKIHEKIWTWEGEEVLDIGEYVILVYLPQ